VLATPRRFEQREEGGPPSDSEPLRAAAGRDGFPGGNPGVTPDPVEVALAEALTRASAAGAWDAVAQLARELEARRRAAGAVVDLDAERTRRGGSGR